MQTPTPAVPYVLACHGGQAARAADLAERVFVLREALRDLLHLDAVEQAGLAGRGHAAEWRGAVRRAVDILNEEGGL